MILPYILTPKHYFYPASTTEHGTGLAGFLHCLRTSSKPLPFTDGRDLSWPQRIYGPHLDLKIYVYDENEVDGLKALMYGRDAREQRI